MSETYELMNSGPWRYLCSVPVIAPPPALNETATELAKAEEARELSRASARGWELMSGLEGHCMYFMSGWWSYSFCYGKGVVQFHALPGANKGGGPPVRDENSQEYVLGRVPGSSWDTAQDTGTNANPDQEGQTTTTTTTTTKGVAPPNSQLYTKDDQRYLVQRLDGGTVCDLTGRPRTIEVQYHCHPGATGDRIGWIKEVTTCTYLMVVYTPRLCADVAFLPPKATRAHPIRCRRVVAGDGDDEEQEQRESSAWRYHERVEAAAAARLGVGSGSGTGTNPQHKKMTATTDKSAEAAAAAAARSHQFSGMTIGGVVVGGRKVVGGGAAGKDGRPTHKLAPPRHLVSNHHHHNHHHHHHHHQHRHNHQQQQQQQEPPPAVEVLASKRRDAAEVEALSDAELEQLSLDPRTVREMRDKLQSLAGDRGWRLELVEVPGEGYEFVGAFDDDDDDDDDGDYYGQEYESGQEQQQVGKGVPPGRQGVRPGGKQALPRAGEPPAAAAQQQDEEGGEGEQEGSQEVFFKEEL